MPLFLRLIKASDDKKEINPYVTLIWIHCEFFKEDDLELEYAAFKVLKSMLQDDRITQVEINAMVEIISRIYSWIAKAMKI